MFIVTELRQISNRPAEPQPRRAPDSPVYLVNPGTTPSAIWYATTRSDMICPWPAEAEPRIPEPWDDQLLGLGGFLSRHWRAVDALARESESNLIRELIRYMWDTGQRLDRNTDPGQLRYALNNWWSERGEYLRVQPGRTPEGKS